MWSENCEAPPAEAITALEYATDLWGDWITSTVPIDVSVCWTSVLNCSGDALACGGPTGYYANFPGAPLIHVQYPAALANALSGADLDPTRVDIMVSFQSGVGWSFSTGERAAGEDFVSVALHELAHGLGFIGNMYVDYSVGFCGDGAYGYLYPCPTPYDWFVVDSGGTPLLSYRTPDPRDLGALLKSDANFGGPNTVAAGAGSARLYTPAAWIHGTSLSHLDQNTYQTGENELMTPSYSGVTRHPGPVTLAILQDLGWIRVDAPNVTASGEQAATAGRAVAWSVQLLWSEYTDQNITYTWTATDHGEIIHAERGITDTVSFNWTTPGPKTVAVMATGMDVPASATYSVSVRHRIHLPIILTQPGR
jgi:hypothetical protein